jgi:thiamine biosynthesis lipoprotein
MERREFRAMGTTVELLLERPAGQTAERALAAAEAEFARLERILSRFDPGSELSALNRAGELRAGPDLRRVVELALDARARSGGRFDPTVHDAVVGAGYDRSFELLETDCQAVSKPARCGGRIELEHEKIRLEPGFRLDFGGIGKGYAVDRAAEILGTAGPCLVNAGGDLTVRGRAWPVGLKTGGEQLTLLLERGAIATSGTERRRWRRGGLLRHHLIDPATGEPSASDLRRVTVVADTAVEADVLAKTLLLAGCDGAAAEADAARTPCLLIREDGAEIRAGGLG